MRDLPRAAPTDAGIIPVSTIDTKHPRPLPWITLPDGTIIQQSYKQFQQDFMDCLDKFVCLGGAIGAGKTLAMLIKLLEELWGYPSNFGLIMRRDLPRLRNSAMVDFLEILPPWMLIDHNKNESTFDVMNAYGYEAVYRFKKNQKLSKRKLKEKLARVRGTSRIVFTSFEGTSQALSKFRSQNLGFYCIEQAEEASIEIYDILIERLRKQPSGRRAYFVANPNGHDWIWRLFHPDSPDKRNNHTMIIGNTLDNDTLPDDYFETLDDVYTEEQKEKLLYSSWDVAPMAYFPEFSVKYHVIEHREPGDTWEKGIGLDHGVNHPTAIVYATFLPSGEVYIYDEYWEKDKIVSDHVREILPKMSSMHRTFMIDPSTNQRTGVGNTVLDQYRLLGVPFQQSSRDPNAGITRIKEYMKYDEHRENPWTGRKGSPRFFISERCVHLIRELQDYQKAEQKANIGHEDPPDKPRKLNDDTVDALRYLLMGFVEPLTKSSEAADAPKIQRLLPMQTEQLKPNPHLRVLAHDDPEKESKDRFGNRVEFTAQTMIEESLKEEPARRTVWKRVNGVSVQSRA